MKARAVYAARGGVLVLATSRAHAHRILKAEYGRGQMPLSIIRRYEGPFGLTNGDESWECSEQDFVETVATYAGGIVHQD